MAIVKNKQSIKRALISVYDKTGLLEIGRELKTAGVEIIATGATCKMLNQADIPAIEVSDLTGFPEILDGRVKSLHPKIHAGILADQSNQAHLQQLTELEIKPFDLVIVNLYPFAESIAWGDFAKSIEEIDIGGATLLRSAAKNFSSISVISSTKQYELLAEAIRDGGFDYESRKELATEAFRLTSEYDVTIAMWLNGAQFPDWMAGTWRKAKALRYGENPQQQAALYINGFPGVASAVQLQGKEMSFNNYLDADAALRAAFDQIKPAVAIVKHTNPCAIAIAERVSDAYNFALTSDPISAYGGVVGVNRKVDLDLANQLIENFTEVLIAPDFDLAALEVLKGKSSLRVLKTELSSYGPFELRAISGGLLMQTSDLIDATGDDPANWKQVSGAQVSESIMADLAFAWRAVRSVKSNAIVLAKTGATVGIGMGQVNRVDAAKLAVSRAGDRAKNSVVASDAFFPFADGIEVLIAAGVSAVVSPGGSMRDEEVIAAAKSKNLPLFFTETRHFTHG